MRFAVATLFLFLVLALGCSSGPQDEALAGPLASDTTVADVLPLADAAGGPTESPRRSGTSDSSSGSLHSDEGDQSSEDVSLNLGGVKGAGTCPIPASRCPDGCASIAGWRLEQAKHCYSRVVIACLPINSDGTYTLAADAACYRRTDGVTLLTSGAMIGSKLGAGWSGCDLTEATPQVPACP